MTGPQHSGPPRPHLALRVGVTGHRLLDPGQAAALPDRIDAVLRTLAAAAERISSKEQALYAPAPSALTCPTQLAAGADQIAAQAALDCGYKLQVVLPLAPAEFRQDFDPPALATFDALLAQAQSSWVLPGRRSNADHAYAYACAGKATVAQCDVLVAVWDGKPARGPGGTADVIDNAVRRGVPVFHLFALAPVLAAGKVLGVLTAALPTIGSAVFGLRGAGDFLGAASRSTRTADRLVATVGLLRRPGIGLAEAASAPDEATAAMLRDLSDWRSAYRSRVLAIPA